MPLDDVTPFYDEITNRAGAGRATIRLQNGDERLGVNVRVSADSVRWVVPDIWSRQFTRPRAVHISQVKEVVIRSKIKGGLIGGVLGALGGFAFSTIPPSTRPQRDARRILLISPLFSGLGAIGGAWAGATRGETDVYLFSEYLEGTDRFLLGELLDGSGPGISELIEQMRVAIRGIDGDGINEEITQSNIVYLHDETQFCYLVVDDSVVRVYLSMKPGEMEDPMGLVRPWSTSDSWFTIIPGGDLDYAMFLVNQAYRSLNP
jgi:predicted transport protein